MYLPYTYKFDIELYIIHYVHKLKIKFIYIDTYHNTFQNQLI